MYAISSLVNIAWLKLTNAVNDYKITSTYTSMNSLRIQEWAVLKTDGDVSGIMQNTYETKDDVRNHAIFVKTNFTSQCN